MRRRIIILSLILLSDVYPAFAVNGLELIGFSAEPLALGGSGHVAIADTSSINTNPAAMSLIPGSRFDVTAGPLQIFQQHSDSFGNSNVEGRSNVTVLGDFGFVTRLSSIPRMTVGTGMFKNSVTHTNPSLPFGPNSKDSISAYYVYNTLSYRF